MWRRAVSVFRGRADVGARLEQHYDMVWFADDDLLAACRPRGLPIGNLTSQFWSNCGRKVRQAGRLLGLRYRDWRLGRISFGAFDASVQGWINHVRYADTWGLRWRLLGGFDLAPALGTAPMRVERSKNPRVR